MKHSQWLVALVGTLPLVLGSSMHSTPTLVHGTSNNSPSKHIVGSDAYVYLGGISELIFPSTNAKSAPEKPIPRSPSPSHKSTPSKPPTSDKAISDEPASNIAPLASPSPVKHVIPEIQFTKSSSSVGFKVWVRMTAYLRGIVGIPFAPQLSHYTKFFMSGKSYAMPFFLWHLGQAARPDHASWPLTDRNQLIHLWLDVWLDWHGHGKKFEIPYVGTTNWISLAPMVQFLFCDDAWGHIWQGLTLEYSYHLSTFEGVESDAMLPAWQRVLKPYIEKVMTESSAVDGMNESDKTYREVIDTMAMIAQLLEKSTVQDTAIGQSITRAETSTAEDHYDAL